MQHDRFKHIAAGITAFLMAAVCLPLPAYCADAEESAAVAAGEAGTIAPEIAVSALSLPADALPAGTIFSVRGLITSAYPLTRVWGGVYTADGAPTDVWHEDAPDSTVYDLNAGFDNYLDVGSLPAGGFVYRIEAEDSTGLVQTVAEKAFSVVEDDSAPSEMQVYNASYPTGTLIQGRGVGIKGRVYSTYVIESVTAGIFKAEGATCDYDDRFAFTVEGGRRSFDLSVIDNDIVFDELPEGEYEYRLIVTDTKGETRELIRSPFRIRSNERTADSQSPVMKGIDISENTTVEDLDRAYADGVDFAIIRAGATSNTDAVYTEDAQFTTHYEGAKAAGLKVGAYLYTSAVTESELRADIEALMQTLAGKQLDMPVYLDMTSSRQSPLSKAALTELIGYGCGLLTENGYEAGVYSSYNWFRDRVDMDVLRDEGYEIWLAFWPNDASTVDMSDFCVTWQYCSDGTVDGITGDVDEDYRYAALSVDRYAVNVVQPEIGTVTADKTTAAYGERVTVTADLDRVHALGSVRVNGMEACDLGDGTFCFTMPEGDVEITVEIVDCAPTVEFDTVTTMPIPFGTASQSSPYFAKPCGDRLSTLPEAVMELTEDGSSWEYSYPSATPPLTLMDHPNIYSFIHSHTIDPAAVRAALSDGDRMLYRTPFTDEEIDILLGDDAALAMATFALPSTIVIGERGYTAKWMYEHTIADYIAAGITPEMVEAVLPYYYDPLYVQAAADAFSQKLFQFTGKLTATKWDQWRTGDVDLDGTVTAADADLLGQYLDYTARLSFPAWASADMNGDSTVDMTDLDLLREAADADPVEEGVELDVIEFCQYPDYPTGCESVSLYMLLDYYDVDVTVEQIYDRLPMGPQPYFEGGVRYGADPEREFVGDPRSYASYGVFNDPIAAVAEQFKSGVKTERGATIADIQTILDGGDPVLAWYVTAPMRPLIYRRSWLDYQTGALVRWPGGEHAIVINGYTDDTLIYRDPNAGTTVKIDYDTFLKSFTELGSRIVYYTTAPAPEEPTEPSDPTDPTDPTDAPTEPTDPTDAPTEPTTEADFATEERMAEMAIRDHAVKTGVTPADAALTREEDGMVSIVLTDEDGAVLDTYTIDPKTGRGTESDGEAIDLPQTGIQDQSPLLLHVLGILAAGVGAALMALSRRRRDEV